MSLLLCPMEPVRHPYRVQELGVRLFSSQELCYVIYEHPLLVMEEFLDERLFQFIREDLHMPSLAGRLENGKKNGESTDNLLLMILSECPYYTASEVNRYRQVLVQLRKKHPAEFGKARADYFFAQRQYGKVIPLYKKLLELPEDHVVNALFYSRIWCCLGACHARMFQAQKAYQAYDQAYAYDNRNEEILKQMYYLKAMFPNLELSARHWSMIKLIHRPEWDEQIRSAQKKGRESEPVQELEALFMKEAPQRMNGAAKLVQQWKQEYRSMM